MYKTYIIKQTILNTKCCAQISAQCQDDRLLFKVIFWISTFLGYLYT